MPRTRQQLEQAAADAAAWLDSLDPSAIAAPGADASDLRAIAVATEAVSDAMEQQATAVAQARRSGKSWSQIAAVLGTSRQAATKRFDFETTPFEEVERTAGFEPA